MTQDVSNLKTLLTQKPYIAGVGARDALDARMVQDAGFDFVWASSFCISASHALPDTSILSMTQFLEAARAMRERISIPILYDADTGYGGPQNMAHAAKLIEDAGMSGYCVEDKTFPKETSLRPGASHTLLPTQSFVDKLHAALSVRKNEAMLVVARTEALIAGLGESEALERAYAYEEAGADCILIHSKSTDSNEIVSFVQNWNGKCPLVLVPTTYPDLTEEAVERLKKVKVVIYGNQLLRASVAASREALNSIRQAGGSHTLNGQLASLSDVFKLQEGE